MAAVSTLPYMFTLLHFWGPPSLPPGPGVLRAPANPVVVGLADYGLLDETIGLRQSQPPAGTMRPSPNPVPAFGWDYETQSSRCALGLRVSPSPEKDHVLLGLSHRAFSPKFDPSENCGR